MLRKAGIEYQISNAEERIVKKIKQKEKAGNSNAKQNIIPYLILLESLLVWSRIYAFYPDSYPNGEQRIC